MEFASDSWNQALDALDPVALFRITGFHLASVPKLAPLFADLRRELRFTDLGDIAKTAFIAGVLSRLRHEGVDAAVMECERALDQLRSDYARRHPRLLGGQDA